MDNQTNTPADPHIAPEPAVINPGTTAEPNPSQAAPATIQPVMTDLPFAQGNTPAFAPSSPKRKKSMIAIMAICIVLFLAVDVFLFTKYRNRVTKDELQQTLKGSSSNISSGSSSDTSKKSTSSPSQTQKSASSAPTANNTAQTATDAAKLFVGFVQANKGTEADAMLTQSFKGEIKGDTGNESYYATCVNDCEVRIINLPKAVATSQPYNADDGTAGEVITLKAPRAKGGFDIVVLSVVKVNGKFLIDNESDGQSVN